MRAILGNEKKVANGKREPNAFKDNGRQTNHEILEAFDVNCVMMNGWGANAFQPPRKVGALPPKASRYYADQMCPLTNVNRMRACIEEEGGTRYFEVPFAVKDGQHYRPTCHFANDMCGGSWYAEMFAVHNCLRGTVQWDYFHRLMCDRDDATQEAGLMAVRLEVAAANALRRKPWGKEGNHRILIAAADDLFESLDSNSELFALHYNSICDALGEHGPDLGSPEHMEKIWLVSKARLKHARLGEEAKKGRWWSIESEGRVLKPTRPMTSMLMNFVGYRRKWFASFAQMPLLSDETHALMYEVEPEAAGSEALEAVDDAPAAAAAEDPPAPEPKEKRMSVKTARQEVNLRRQQCVNHMQYTSRIIASRRTMALFDGMSYLTKPLEERFNDNIRDAKTKRGTLDWQIGLVEGSFTSVLVQLFGGFTSAGFRDAVGLQFFTRIVKVSEYNGKVISTLWTFLVALISSLSLTHQEYDVPPKAFLGLLSKDEEKRKSCLERLSLFFKYVEMYEDLANTNKHVRENLKHMEWPLNFWSRENLSYL